MIPDKKTIVLLATLVLASGFLVPVASAFENIPGGENLTSDLPAPEILPEGDVYPGGLNDTVENRSENLAFHSSSLSRINNTKQEFIYQDVIFAAGSPVADFNATPRTGPAPLAVQFLDNSTGSPYEWGWDFGDEWWIARQTPGAVVMPDGTIIVIGGGGDLDYSNDPSYSYVPLWRLYNDTWKSTDNGTSWTPVDGSCEWTARRAAATAVLPDGKIILVGGHAYTGYTTETWQSADQGATWTRVNANGGWTPREGMALVVFPDGTLVMSGGTAMNAMTHYEDTWRSLDGGITWMKVNEHGGWSGRFGHTMTVMPDNSIVLTGGYRYNTGYLNDTWRSTDKGSTWTKVNTVTSYPGRFLHSTVVLQDGNLLLSGGFSDTGVKIYYNDTWRSTNMGVTWTRLNGNCSWMGRRTHSSVVMPDGSIVLMGGSKSSSDYKNDVWRSTDGGYVWTEMGHGPINSPWQNPVHTYTKPGNYSVSLRATNVEGTHRKVKTEYMMVGEPVPPQTEFYVYAEGVGTYHGTMDDLSLGNITPEEFYNLINGQCGTVDNEKCWNGRGLYIDDQAGSVHWNTSEQAGSYSDNADFSVFVGHGWDNGIAFGTPNSVLELEREHMSFGGTKAKWVSIFACDVLNQSTQANWESVFNGVHMVNGFDTHGLLFPLQGSKYAKMLTGIGGGYDRKPIKTAWKEMLKETINKNSIKGASMWVEPCGNDYLPGFGEYLTPIKNGQGEYIFVYENFNCSYA